MMLRGERELGCMKVREFETHHKEKLYSESDSCDMSEDDASC